MRRLTGLLFMLVTTTFAVHQPVRAKRAMVVTREANATTIGVEVLKSGGNAVDAAIAVGFALAVTHPSAGNLGGGGFMLFFVPPDQRDRFEVSIGLPWVPFRISWEGSTAIITED